MEALNKIAIMMMMGSLYTVIILAAIVFAGIIVKVIIAFFVTLLGNEPQDK